MLSITSTALDLNHDSQPPLKTPIENLEDLVNAVIQSPKPVSNEPLVFNESIKKSYDSARGLSLNEIGEGSYTRILAPLQPVDGASCDMKFLESVLKESKDENKKIEDSLSLLIYDKYLVLINKDYLTVERLKERDDLSRTFNSLLLELSLSAQHYGSAVRTLFVQGVSHLMRYSIDESKLEKLKKTIFAFPIPTPGSEKTLEDFAVPPGTDDPLDKIDAYVVNNHQ
ncbi:hypothetical protein SK355_10130 [Candidatus Fukatsuia symbiotica]|uniref:Uncharacterized protein n=1 Tax=Candidatus Fukatsuia symbiotica TaxID=1878942 RepID=A0A2U8I648_9GAMM|nr:hypothetical protein [Candidatus Fukatsuia symbiotica]AWK13715.1 hypothetical protein CCS41_03255 [Candidatus Fukatsuia symbiotica]MEA9445554.1 hypothetical protein [Candidatus Fukatsuia symbiotica]